MSGIGHPYNKPRLMHQNYFYPDFESDNTHCKNPEPETNKEERK